MLIKVGHDELYDVTKVMKKDKDESASDILVVFLLLSTASNNC